VEEGLILKICQNFCNVKSCQNLKCQNLIYSVSYFNLGTSGFAWRGEAHQRTPVATGQNPPELPTNDETRDDAHIASTGVKLY